MATVERDLGFSDVTPNNQSHIVIHMGSSSAFRNNIEQPTSLAKQEVETVIEGKTSGNVAESAENMPKDPSDPYYGYPVD